ncbi:hypothetical protein BDZ97DRAFT_2017624 [Flammula alnicola]|nr:hypothetical protein BDZ97DRAFT_2017624 [Flammula alnicola]
MKDFVFTFFAALLLSHISAFCSTANIAGNSTDQRRAANTCADPTLADVFVEAFNPSLTAHVIRIQGEVFRAWQTAQDFMITVPIYQLYDPTIQDYIFLTSTNSNPPIAGGYETGGIIGYVYSTQVCGSVPLLVAFQASAGDHWYTTSASEHSSLLADGWTDAGVAAFVLPLNDSILQVDRAGVRLCPSSFQSGKLLDKVVIK